MTARSLLALAFAVSVAAPTLAIEAGKAAGTATIDGTTTLLAFAVETRKDNLFDDKKRDTVYVLTNKALVATRPDDEVGLSLKARSGELVVLALRMDGSTSAKAGSGTLKLAKRDFDGHAYAVDVEFAASRYVAPRKNAAPAPAPPASSTNDRTSKQRS